MQFKGSHYALLVLTALSGAALAVAHSMPQYAGAAHVVTAVCGAVGSILGLTSPSITGAA